MQSDENEALTNKPCSVQKPSIHNFQLFHCLYYDFRLSLYDYRLQNCNQDLTDDI